MLRDGFGSRAFDFGDLRGWGTYPLSVMIPCFGYHDGRRLLWTGPVHNVQQLIETSLLQFPLHSVNQEFTIISHLYNDCYIS